MSAQTRPAKVKVKVAADGFMCWLGLLYVFPVRGVTKQTSNDGRYVRTKMNMAEKRSLDDPNAPHPRPGMRFESFGRIVGMNLALPCLLRGAGASLSSSESFMTLDSIDSNYGALSVAGS